MPDLSVEAISRLSPSELVLLIDSLDPSTEGLADVDIDAIARNIDPARLSGDEFVRLISGLQRLSSVSIDLAKMGPRTFAKLISGASKEQLEEVLSRPELRKLILGEIFRRMSTHLKQDKAVGVDAVVHWRFSEGSGEGGYDRYETVIANGTCTINREMTKESRVTITMPPQDFLRLVTSNASAPVLFMMGKLKLRGDLPFAAGMLHMFDLPKP
ncbi:SCP2 sterol-binding domain-containing protein [Kibdelosporangium philippinense]|uniref:SCP2 sterol-binding domain-containing protein n=1 Tax=Kibdelosporangium philippinense TaxID=211113 RepID=A0ABS8ZBF6_9PSEU|nr:SCP2 sterol-binding domain-containing protein [Kibdelosporangium philippinense]MCE7005189.1 SCP2 sterol-binding domain-containing protein [Kibdelosporangium philippinense]